MVLNQSHWRFVSLPENFTKKKKTHIKLLNISFRVFELFHKCLSLIQKLKRYPPFVKKRDLTRSPVEYFIKPCHNFSFICTGKTPEMKSDNVFSFSNPPNCPRTQTVSGTIGEPQILSRFRTAPVSAHYIAASKGISSCYYGPFVCSDTSIIGSNFLAPFLL